LNKYGFPGDEIPIIRGSSLPAYQNPSDPEKTKCISDLLDAVDAYIPQPIREEEKAFLMAIEDVFRSKAAERSPRVGSSEGGSRWVRKSKLSA
jgi:translation elongation factor EF-Tu-like GTPase